MLATGCEIKTSSAPLIRNRLDYRYHDSTQSFAALAAQCASLSQSESTLFDVDHPPLIGNAPSELVFVKLNTAELQQQRTKLGLNRWDESLDQEPGVLR